MSIHNQLTQEKLPYNERLVRQKRDTLLGKDMGRRGDSIRTKKSLGRSQGYISRDPEIVTYRMTITRFSVYQVSPCDGRNAHGGR